MFVWNIESVSPDLRSSRQDTYLTERGQDEKFNLCPVTRSRSEIATKKRETSGVLQCYPEIERKLNEQAKEIILSSYKTFLNKISKIIMWCVFLIYNYYYYYFFFATIPVI